MGALGLEDREDRELKGLGVRSARVLKWGCAS